MHDLVDPGPGLRERADRQAQHLSAAGWMALVHPLLALSFVDDAPWDHPALAVPAFVVLGSFFIGLTVVSVRFARDGRRWLADPPGPPREMPPPLRWQGWIRWCAVLGATGLVLGFVAGLLAGGA